MENPQVLVNKYYPVQDSNGNISGKRKITQVIELSNYSAVVLVFEGFPNAGVYVKATDVPKLLSTQTTLQNYSEL